MKIFHFHPELQSRINFASNKKCYSLLSPVWKLKQQWLHMRLRRKLNVYVFVMTTISTWTNGNLLEPTCKHRQTCKASDQPHWFVSRIQYVCRPININFPRAMREGKSWVGTQSSCITSSSLHSHFCFNLHVTRWHKNCVSEFFLPTSPHVPFK